VEHATHVAAIVAAAGRGERLGCGVSKALRPIGGHPIVVYAVDALARSPFVELVLVAAPRASLTEFRNALAGHRFPADVRVVAGGSTRHESVALALTGIPPETEIVLVHDAARAFAPTAMVDSVIAAVCAGAPAVVPAVPVVDTVKEVGADQLVRSTLDRTALRVIQTPQAFRREVLEQAHAKSPSALMNSEQPRPREAPPATDDAGLVERLGIPVLVVPGSEDAFKITTALDLLLAEAIVMRGRVDVIR
jgi:2-C-methyl-D-erythritol 4-phosphate cytidylyltransferase